MMSSLLGLLVLVGAPRWARSQPQAQQQTAVTAQTKQSTTTSAREPKAEVREGTKISAVLVSRIDARTAKPGEKLVALVTKNIKQNGRTVIHKGDEIVGRVTAVLAGTYKAGSQVTVAFDQLVSGGAAARLNAVLAQVVALPGPRLRPDNQDIDGPMMPMGRRGRRESSPSVLQDPGLANATPGGDMAGSMGGSLGTLGQTAHATVAGPAGRVNGAANTIGSITPGNDTRTSLSTPLQELHVKSDLQGENPSKASTVLSSRHGNLRLDSGTHVQFRVAAEARAQSAGR